MKICLVIYNLNVTGDFEGEEVKVAAGKCAKQEEEDNKKTHQVVNQYIKHGNARSKGSCQEIVNITYTSFDRFRSLL